MFHHSRQSADYRGVLQTTEAELRTGGLCQEEEEQCGERRSNKSCVVETRSIIVIDVAVVCGSMW